MSSACQEAAPPDERDRPWLGVNPITIEPKAAPAPRKAPSCYSRRTGTSRNVWTPRRSTGSTAPTPTSSRNARRRSSVEHAAPDEPAAQDIRVDRGAGAARRLHHERHPRGDARDLQLQPMHAVEFAQNLIVAASVPPRQQRLDLVIPCHSGNHARTTQDHALRHRERALARVPDVSALAAHFRNDPRVTFRIATGITRSSTSTGEDPVPPRARDQLPGRHRRHLHPRLQGDQSVGQGEPAPTSTCSGTSTRQGRRQVHLQRIADRLQRLRAVSIKADFEPPKQTLFLIDKERGRTCTWPVLFQR
jgi:hypothetical protein